MDFFIDLPLPPDFDVPVNLYKYSLEGTVVAEHQGAFQHDTLVGKTLQEVIGLDPAFEERWNEVVNEKRSTTWFTWTEPIAGKHVGPLIRGLMPVHLPIPDAYLEFLLPLSPESEAFLKKISEG